LIDLSSPAPSQLIRPQGSWHRGYESVHRQHGRDQTFVQPLSCGFRIRLIATVDWKLCKNHAFYRRWCQDRLASIVPPDWRRDSAPPTGNMRKQWSFDASSVAAFDFLPLSHRPTLRLSQNLALALNRDVQIGASIWQQWERRLVLFPFRWYPAVCGLNDLSCWPDEQQRRQSRSPIVG
jgi:hypothetical protein